MMEKALKEWNDLPIQLRLFLVIMTILAMGYILSSIKIPKVQLVRGKKTPDFRCEGEQCLPSINTGQNTEGNLRDRVQEELQPYLDEIEAQGKKRGVNFDVYSKGIYARIKDLPKAAGVCQRHNTNDLRKVHISKDHWEAGDESLRLLIVVHEWGHCYFGFRHDDTREDGICKFIMNSGTTGCTWKFSNDMEGYFDRFFDRVKTSMEYLEIKKR